MRRWSTPCAASRPASDCARLRSEPRTLTNTVAWRKSVDVSTPVTVMNPIRGSLSSPIASARTARTDSLTRRIRSLIQSHHLPLDAHALELLPVEVALRVVQQQLDVVVVPCDA